MLPKTSPRASPRTNRTGDGAAAERMQGLETANAGLRAAQPQARYRSRGRKGGHLPRCALSARTTSISSEPKAAQAGTTTATATVNIRGIMQYREGDRDGGRSGEYQQA